MHCNSRLHFLLVRFEDNINHERITETKFTRGRGVQEQKWKIATLIFSLILWMLHSISILSGFTNFLVQSSCIGAGFITVQLKYLLLKINIDLDRSILFKPRI